MSKGSEIVKSEDGLLKLFEENNIDITEVAAAVHEAIGSGELRQNDLERIRLPGAGGTTWTIETAGGEVETKELVGAIIGDQITRVYWEDPFGGGKSAPSCFSTDGVTGIGTPGGECAGCPFNAFAIWRLGARALPEPEPGLDRAERGNL